MYSLKEAKINGSQFYIGGICSKGHGNSIRYTSTRQCVECKKIWSITARKEYRARPETKIKESLYNKEYYSRPEIIKKVKIQKHNYWMTKSREAALVGFAKCRAKKLNLHFDIDEEYIKAIWPVNNLCPYTLLELKPNKGSKMHNICSPTLDRIIPNKGYVKGNVLVVSFKGNRIKQDEINPAVFERIANILKDHINK